MRVRRHHSPLSLLCHHHDLASASADVVADGGLADDGEVIDMTDGDEDDPREIHWRWSE